MNVERDTSSDVLDSYIVTARTTDLIRRLVTAIRKPTSGRALSLTGPYGCGKSSVAVFVASLLAKEKDERRLSAEQLLRDADRALLTDVRLSRQEIGAGVSGFLTAAVTAQREPVTLTLTRALETSTRAAARDASSRRAETMLKKVAERASAISRRVTRGGQTHANRRAAGASIPTVQDAAQGFGVFLLALERRVRFVQQQRRLLAVARTALFQSRAMATSPAAPVCWADGCSRCCRAPKPRPMSPRS